MEDNGIEGVISDISINAGGRKIKAEDIVLSNDGKVYTLTDNEADEEYALEFSFKRTSGRRGLKICFGKKTGENTYILWEFGGWDNWDCNISSFVRGRGATISHRIFHVTDEPYRLRLEVKGRRIRTFVYGELMNDTVDRLPELEELYVSASKDAAGDLYLKCVNLTGEDKAVKVALEGYSGCGALGTVLSGNLSDENSFEKENLVPESFSEMVGSDGFTHVFPAHSITTFKMGG